MRRYFFGARLSPLPFSFSTYTYPPPLCCPHSMCGCPIPAPLYSLWPVVMHWHALHSAALWGRQVIQWGRPWHCGSALPPTCRLSFTHGACACPPPLHSFWARGQIRPLLCGIVRRAGDPAGHQQAIKSTRAGKKRHIDRRRSSIHIYRCSRCPSPTPKGRRLPSESSSAPTEARGFTYTNTRRALLDYPRDSDLPNGRHRSGVVQPPNAPSTM